MISKFQQLVLTRSLNHVRCQFYKKIRDVPTEEFIAVQKPQVESKYEHVKIEIKEFDNQNKPERNLGDQKPVPVSPLLGPYKIENPKLGEKKYRWCSCGLSTSQPFCDGKHKGTAFQPYKFTVEEATQYMNLCGCKFTTNPPFCDNKTCKCLTSGNTEKQE
ncbi:hypothetical protein ABPG72_010165 [Tetrahymena utriculariae]